MFKFNLQLHAETAGLVSRTKILAGSVAMAGGAAPTGAYIIGVDNRTFSRLCDVLEVAAEGDTYKKRIVGLKDTNFSISGNFYSGDTTGQQVLIPGNLVMVGCYPEGPAVAGYQVNAIVTSYELTSTADGKQTFSAAFSCIAAPVALPLIT